MFLGSYKFFQNTTVVPVNVDKKLGNRLSQTLTDFESR